MPLSKTERARKAGSTITERKSASSRANGQTRRRQDGTTAILSLRVLEADKTAYQGMDATDKERIMQAMQATFARLIIEAHIV